MINFETLDKYDNLMPEYILTKPTYKVFMSVHGITVFLSRASQMDLIVQNSDTEDTSIDDFQVRGKGRKYKSFPRKGKVIGPITLDLAKIFMQSFEDLKRNNLI